MFIYSLTFLDAYTRKTTRTYELVATAYVDARAAADALLVDVQALTLGGVIRDQLSEVEDIATAPGAGSNVDVGVTIQMSLGGSKVASINFPMPIAAAINSDSSLNLTQTQVANFLANFTGGDVLVSDGEAVVSVLKGKLDK